MPLVRITVVEGDQVKKDQVIATIDPRELAADSAYYSSAEQGATAQVHEAQQDFPSRPVEAPKAWKEMIHRYLASTLGLLILALALLSFRDGMPRALPRALVLLVVFQGLLGMWTVTWLLKPLVVTGHLLGGMTTLAPDVATHAQK